MSHLRRIDFCCNEDGGVFGGRVRMIDFAGALTLEGDAYGRGFAFAVEGNRVRIHRKWFEFEATRGGGNWYWQGFLFKPMEAKRLLRHVKDSGKWSVDGGWTKLFNWFDRA